MKKGMNFAIIAKLLGFVVTWYVMWRESGLKALKVAARGVPKGSGSRFNPFEQEHIRKCLIEKSPDQLKMPFVK